MLWLFSLSGPVVPEESSFRAPVSDVRGVRSSWLTEDMK